MLLLICLVVLGCSLNLAFAENPYSALCLRNAFALRPAASAVTGITTILRGKRALLKVERPGEPLIKAESYILAEGQRQGPLQVLQIDEKAARVQVAFSGTVTNLSFDPATPAPASKTTLIRGRSSKFFGR